ncbi:plasmid partitioning protein RepB [Mesobacterium sp. TK19101]|uniref:Plasmid partitioning protein RepB n=1 Tax=Mesobacterium hydrothermale TaxID=3111907 RepID=A0ABU6HK29_9RHOB|nr:plasmid partitioning protein RepB [Mesobacterium sp. TK19101]MEC3862813.1 plasmid partitioning protein RepB [Mesobacterium sp. TK19101]
MARKGILTPSDDTPAKPRKQPDRLMPRGAVGALQSSLTRLQENAVQDLDPHLIDAAGVADRLGVDEQADETLRESLKTYGQQVPVLVRPHTNKPGRFEIVYGRRRVLALRDLGLPVKAMVRQLDDHALVLAQGQENTARQDLSFIEKASFAAQLDAEGYDRQTICDALSIDLPMVSRMLKVGKAFDIEFLRQIGSAPGIGRERWMKLADAIQDDDVRDRVEEMLSVTPFIETSDARFEQVLACALNRRKDPKPAEKPVPARTLRRRDGTRLADLKRSARALTLTIPMRDADGFDDWFETHAEALLQELHDRWSARPSED